MDRRPTYSRSEFNKALNKSCMEIWHHICTSVGYEAMGKCFSRAAVMEAMGNASVEPPSWKQLGGCINKNEV